MIRWLFQPQRYFEVWKIGQKIILNSETEMWHTDKVGILIFSTCCGLFVVGVWRLLWGFIILSSLQEQHQWYHRFVSTSARVTFHQVQNQIFEILFLTCVYHHIIDQRTLSNNLSKFTSRLSTASKLTHFKRNVFHRHLSPKYLFGSQVNHNYWRTFPRYFGCKQYLILQLLTQICWFLRSSS